MSRPPSRITETLIIPRGSAERFVRFSPSAHADGWLGQGILVGGISELTPGYEVRRPECGHHFIGYVTAGAPVFGAAPDERLKLEPGQVFFLPARGLHYYSCDHPFTMIWFHLQAAHPGWLGLAGRTHFHRAARTLIPIGALMEQAFNEVQSPPVSVDGVAESFCNLIAALLRRELAQGAEWDEGELRARLEQVWQEAGRKLDQAWTVPLLARRAGLSVSYFYAAVQKIYNVTPMQIVRDLRIGRAQALLLHTSAKLEDIARQTGYESQFSLSRAFKNKLGFGPQEFRRGITRGGNNPR